MCVHVISDCTDDTICPKLNEIEDGGGQESERTSSGRSLTPDSGPRSGALFLQPPEDGALLASYSVFVVGELGMGRNAK